MISSNHSPAELQLLHQQLVEAAGSFQEHRDDPIVLERPIPPLPALSGEELLAYCGFVIEAGKVIKARYGLSNN